ERRRRPPPQSVRTRRRRRAPGRARGGPFAPGRRQHADQGAGRPRRGGGEGGAAGRRHAPRVAHARRVHHLEGAGAEQAERVPRPPERGGRRRGPALGAGRGDAGGELPARRAGSDGPGPRRAAGGQPAPRRGAHQRLGTGRPVPAQARLRHPGGGLLRLRRAERLQRPRTGAAAHVHGGRLRRPLRRRRGHDRAAARGGRGRRAGDRPVLVRPDLHHDGTADGELAADGAGEAAHRQPLHQLGAAQRLPHRRRRLGLPLGFHPGDDGEAAPRDRATGAGVRPALPHQRRPASARGGAGRDHRRLHRRAEPRRNPGALRPGRRDHRSGDGRGAAGPGPLRRGARGAGGGAGRGHARRLAAHARRRAAPERHAGRPGAAGAPARRTQRRGARTAARPRRAGPAARRGRRARRAARSAGGTRGAV
ncbi:MAG: CAIB/BAIF family protein, partial [uncultured Acetobacteraceae bacterium]